MLTPAFCYIPAALILTKNRRRAQYMCALILCIPFLSLTILTSSMFIGIPFSITAQYLKLITWGTLPGILVLALLRPSLWNGEEP